MSGWIRAVVCTAFICAGCSALVTDGRMKKAAELVCGLAMILAVISPIREINFERYSISAAEYKQRAESLIKDAGELKENLDRRYIEESLSAYILDKAKNAGVEPVSVNVTAEWSKDGFWYPASAEIVLSSAEDETACGSVKAIIEAELGIETARQNWRTA